MHRDLKPENILITSVKVLDVGLTRLVPSPIRTLSAAETRTRAETTDGVVLGTVGYISPEQVRGIAADHRSDIFSFGVVKEDPPPVTVNDTAMAPALSRLVAHCLEKEPAERSPDMRLVLSLVYGPPSRILLLAMGTVR